ncbi:hypothetical protein OV203_30270 [Nannocystis sp. ILAH1]|uniref:hypothetical protein n=1 Tax=unclassified Nannocystis TaxID=2627009 RepID=UPI00226FDB8C|nr:MULTISPECIES: hypothetical protein [unclassified Nannocystis]MCY0991467.1 hypothetical protein [Nannocystis sp. ILAH1]MCY1066516.1 hypothetical protein [Nannocystis sp. RBIL2]
MTRAHPPLHLSVRALAWAAAAALAGAACNSDDREQFPGSTSGTTEVDPTVVPEFTTAEPMETTMVPEPPPSPKSCRDAIGCALQCAIMIPDPTPPEYPWQECFFTNCLEEINYVEWLKLFDLTECVVEACSATPACMDGTDECNGCYIQKLGGTNPPPPECVDQANACK